MESRTDGWVQKAITELRWRKPMLVDHPDDDVETWAAVTGRNNFHQESSEANYTEQVLLEDHLWGCTKWAERFARFLPEPLKETVIQAAALHDIGKADGRFQAWLRGGNPVKPRELLAKSGRSGQNRVAIERARRLSGYPKGGRHELLSVALLQGQRHALAGVDFDLLLHLIESHHGRCRPFAPVVEDSEPVQVDYNGRRSSSDHGLEQAGSGISERFWRLTCRYGWYGLAYLEALLRLADHRQSEVEQGAIEADEQSKSSKQGDTIHA
jgi:CRISPR-associated endonuclease/helicase Cas3